MRRSTEARKLLAALDAELAESGVAAGQQLVWSTAEAAVLDAIANAVDRKVMFSRQLDKADTTTARLAISVEIRLLESHIARLLKTIKTDIPVPAVAGAPLSAASARASRAGAKGARSRWHSAQG